MYVSEVHEVLQIGADAFAHLRLVKVDFIVLILRPGKTAKARRRPNFPFRL